MQSHGGTHTRSRPDRAGLISAREPERASSRRSTAPRLTG